MFTTAAAAAAKSETAAKQRARDLFAATAYAASTATLNTKTDVVVAVNQRLVGMQDPRIFEMISTLSHTHTHTSFTVLRCGMQSEVEEREWDKYTYTYTERIVVRDCVFAFLNERDRKQLDCENYIPKTSKMWNQLYIA